MIEFSIQIQPECDSLSAQEYVESYLSSVGISPDISVGEDKGRYINFHFNSLNAIETWAIIKPMILENHDVERSAIICCQGDDGWANYLLLHHYDKSEKLDGFKNH